MPTLDWFCESCRLRHREPLPGAPAARACRECDAANALKGAASGAPDAAGRPSVKSCPHCGAPGLWDKRDFPARLGWGLVALGLAATVLLVATGHPFYAFLVMGSFVIVDIAAYALTPPMSVCYNCMGELRGVAPDHGPFEIHKAEEYVHALEGLGEGAPGRDETPGAKK